MSRLPRSASAASSDLIAAQKNAARRWRATRMQGTIDDQHGQHFALRASSGKAGMIVQAQVARKAVKCARHYSVRTYALTSRTSPAVIRLGKSLGIGGSGSETSARTAANVRRLQFQPQRRSNGSARTARAVTHLTLTRVNKRAPLSVCAMRDIGWARAGRAGATMDTARCKCQNCKDYGKRKCVTVRHPAPSLPKGGVPPRLAYFEPVRSRRTIFIRFASQRDVPRLVAEGIIKGPPPKSQTWPQRITKWLEEQQAGRRLLLVAEDESGLLGMVQLVFSFPPGYNDPESANGMDVAMMETLRTRDDAPPEVGNKLVDEVQRVAAKRNVKTLTFCLPMNANKALRQAKGWGFEEFRIMPEPKKMLAFFRKSID